MRTSRVALGLALFGALFVVAGCSEDSAVDNATLPTAVVSGTTESVASASNAGGAFVYINTDGCIVVDAELEIVPGDLYKTVCTPSRNGNITMKCYGTVDPASPKAVRWNYANTGFECSSDICGPETTTTRWSNVVDTEGNAVLTCTFNAAT